MRTKACLHLLTLAWVITWVVTVPLFHTHLPDVNDELAPHQGLAHTVFSPDLPGEFSCAHRDGFHLSTRSLNSPELGFVLSSTEDHNTGTYQDPSVLFICSQQFDSRSVTQSAVESRAAPHKFPLLSGQRPSRAPPTIVSS